MRVHLVADGGGSSAVSARLRPARAEHLREVLQSGDDGRWKSHLLVLVGRETATPLRGDGSACLTLGDQRVEFLTCQQPRHGAGVAERVRRFAAGRTRGGGTGRGCHRGQDAPNLQGQGLDGAFLRAGHCEDNGLGAVPLDLLCVSDRFPCKRSALDVALLPSRWGVRHGTGHWRPRAGLARRVAARGPLEGRLCDGFRRLDC